MSQEKKINIEKAVLLFILLVVLPLGSIYYLSSGYLYYKDELKDLTPKGKLSNFELVNHYGEPFNQDSLKGKIVIGNFFFSHCPNECVDMANNLLVVQEAFREQEKVIIVSHTVDTVNDSVAVLKQYADNIGAKPRRWYFLTGKKEDIYTLAKKDYQLPAGENDNANDFIHSPYFVLLDTSLNIRNYYDGTDPKAVSQMITQITLIMPRQPKRAFKYQPETEK